MKKFPVILSAIIILIALAFAGCKGADGGKITDISDDTPVLTQLETELSSMADRITDIVPDMSGDMTGNITNNTAM